MSVITLKQCLHTGFQTMFGLLRNGLALVGAAAMLMLTLEEGTRFPLPEPTVGKSTVVGIIRYDGMSISQPDAPDNPEHSVIANYLSRRYKVALDATKQLVSGAYDAGRQLKVDPLLILAVMGVESRFNPIAESVMGAKGLMQVIPKYHPEKFVEHGGIGTVLDPMTNILVGARILKEYTRRAGSIEAGLQLYSGGLLDTTGQYAQKVLAELGRLRRTVNRQERKTRKGSSA